MRTIDPEIWSTRLKEYRLQGSVYKRYGQQPAHGYEVILRRSLVDTVWEYRKNCSIPGVKYIDMEEMNKSNRYCYTLCLFVSVVLGLLAVCNTMSSFAATPPLVISGLSSEELITDVNFPAVAVCSNNIISRVALDNYTEYLYNHPKNQNKAAPYNRSSIRSNLNNYGALLVMSLPRLQQDFEEFLLQVEPAFNVTDLMFRLSPACSSLLRRCSWRGRSLRCAALFSARTTSLGFCCVFNSRYYPEDANNEPYVLNLTGQNYGLGFVITENRDDFTYVRRNAYGAEMLIFEGSEYPMLESGDVRMYPVPRNYSLFASVVVMTQHADDDITFYSEERRGCRTEGAGRSQCLAGCRRDTAAALCQCVPYSLHAALPHDPERVCSLHDLACLHKHRAHICCWINLFCLVERNADSYPRALARPVLIYNSINKKFMYVYPWSAEGEEALAEELQDSLDCGECLVACRRRRYSARLSYANYDFKNNIYRNLLTENLSLVNGSVVRLFYSSECHERHVLDVAVRWYELFAKLCALWMMAAGVSTSCAVELVYHYSIRWVHHFVRRARLANAYLRVPSMRAPTN